MHLGGRGHHPRSHHYGTIAQRGLWLLCTFYLLIKRLGIPNEEFPNVQNWQPRIHKLLCFYQFIYVLMGYSNEVNNEITISLPEGINYLMTLSVC